MPRLINQKLIENSFQFYLSSSIPNYNHKKTFWFVYSAFFSYNQKIASIRYDENGIKNVEIACRYGMSYNQLWGETTLTHIRTIIDYCLNHQIPHIFVGTDGKAIVVRDDKTYTKYKNTEKEECSICLEVGNKKFVKTNCGHIFHKSCIDEWNLRSNNCPMCRKDLSIRL